MSPASIHSKSTAPTSAMRSERQHSNHDDAKPETSTICYEHEPFDSIQPKIAEIAENHFKRDLSKVKVTRMRGGNFNRIARIIIAPQYKKFSPSWFKPQCLGSRQKTKSYGAQSYIFRMTRDLFEDATDLDTNREIVIKTLLALSSHYQPPKS